MHKILVEGDNHILFRPVRDETLYFKLISTHIQSLKGFEN